MLHQLCRRTTPLLRLDLAASLCLDARHLLLVLHPSTGHTRWLLLLVATPLRPDCWNRGCAGCTTTWLPSWWIRYWIGVITVLALPGS